MARRRVTVVLEPRTDTELVPLSTFRTAIEQVSILLNEVASEISEPKPRRISWGIAQLSLDSPAKVSVESTQEAEGIDEYTATAVVEGFTKLQKERIRPKYFNDNALESAQRLARLTTDHLARVNIYTDIPDQQVYLTEQIAVNITSILEYLDYHGSVEGRLELISGREGQPLYFKVQDRINNVSVRCYIPDALLDKALSAFRERVIVSGIIKSDNNGIPRSIRAESIEIVPDKESLPQAEDIVREMKDSRFGIQPYGYQS